MHEDKPIILAGRPEAHITRDKITIVECDDYCAVFVNGENVWDNHSIDAMAVFEALNVDVETFYIADEREAEEFPWRQKTFDPATLPPSITA